MTGQFERLPGGRNSILFGGTRREFKSSRPWQAPLENFLDPGACPFCNKPQEEIALPSGPIAGWKLLPNAFTPHNRHTLVVPDRCWSEDELQRWGGESSIATAMQIAETQFTDNRKDIALLVHVGPYAGQNLGHAHMHVLDVRPDSVLPSKDLQEAGQNEKVLIFENSDFRVVAAGAHAGECLIIPQNGWQVFNGAKLASVINMMIERGNERFVSTQGLRPNYGFAVRLSIAGGCPTFRYADYCPILHLQGVYEQSVCTFEGTPYILPWPHEETAARLR